MSRIALLIEYDGTDFSGWQYQHHTNTVQGNIQAALQRVFGLEIGIHGAGRTDTGVHAVGQVAHFDLPQGALPVPTHKIPLAANPFLLPDIRLRDAVDVPSGFHSRFHAIRREYKFYIAKHDTVFARRFAWLAKGPLDVTLMNAVGASIIGERDFTPLSKFNETTESYICNLTHCDVTETEFGLCITIIANRFVYSMCRAIVGAMVAVSNGRVSQDEFLELFNSGARTERLPLAPCHSLFLQSVSYHNDIFGHDKTNLPPFI